MSYFSAQTVVGVLYTKSYPSRKYKSLRKSVKDSIHNLI